MNDWTHDGGSCLGLIMIWLQVRKKKSSDLIEFKFLIGSTAGGNYTNCFFEQNPRRMENLLSSVFYKRKGCRGSSAEFWGALRD